MDSNQCCELWPRIREELFWFQLEYEPNTLVMPCLDGTKPGAIRVNHCPSCGAYIRNITWNTNE